MAGRVFAGVPRTFVTTLGETVEYTPQGGSPISLQGIFTKDHYAALEGGEVQVDSAQPAVSFASSDAPNARHGDTVLVGAQLYTVISVQPDGMGMTALILREAS